MPQPVFYVLCLLTMIFISCQQFSSKVKKKEIVGLNVDEKVEVSYMNWEYSLDEPTRLKKVQITLVNRSKGDLAKIRYRLHLYVYEGKEKREVFSKAYYYENLFSGDVVKIPINDLNEFNLGIPISNENRWYWDAEIEKAK